MKRRASLPIRRGALLAAALLGLLLTGACGGKNDTGPAPTACGKDGAVSGAACSGEGAMCYSANQCVNWTCTAGVWVMCQCGCGA